MISLKYSLPPGNYKYRLFFNDNGRTNYYYKSWRPGIDIDHLLNTIEWLTIMELI